MPSNLAEAEVEEPVPENQLCLEAGLDPAVHLVVHDPVEACL